MWLDGVIARLTTFLALQMRKSLVGLGGRVGDLAHSPACQTGSLCAHRRHYGKQEEGEVVEDIKGARLVGPTEYI